MIRKISQIAFAMAISIALVFVFGFDWQGTSPHAPYESGIAVSEMSSSIGLSPEEQREQGNLSQLFEAEEQREQENLSQLIEAVEAGIQLRDELRDVGIESIQDLRKIEPEELALIIKAKKAGARLSDVDAAIESLLPANIAFNVPNSMEVNKTETIHLVLGAAKSTPAEIAKMIDAGGKKEVAKIKISNRMVATLTGGKGLDIKNITENEQAVAQKDTTEWKWEVTPNSAGSQKLRLALTAIIKVDGDSTNRHIRTFEKDIEVRVSWGHRLSSFASDAHNLFWTVLGTAFFSLIIKIFPVLLERFRRKEASAG